MQLSVIVPFFNAQDHIRETISAILAQTHEDLEVICVDDGSRDESLAILRELAEKDAPLRILRHAKNLGVSAARNTGIKAAKGQWLCFIDSDDAPAPDFCARLLSHGQKSGTDIAKGSYAYQDGKGTSCEINKNARLDKNRCHIQLCSCLFRAQFLRDAGIFFAGDLIVSEDIVFMVQAALAAGSIAVDDDALLHISLRNGSSTFRGVSREQILAHIQAFRRVAHLLADGEVAAESRAYVLASLLALVAEMISRNIKPAIRHWAAHYLGQAFWHIARSPIYDHGLFLEFWPERLAPFLQALENGDAAGLLGHFDRDRASLCRRLLGRKK